MSQLVLGVEVQGIPAKGKIYDKGHVTKWKKALDALLQYNNKKTSKKKRFTMSEEGKRNIGLSQIQGASQYALEQFVPTVLSNGAGGYAVGSSQNLTRSASALADSY
jgi:hypothetical protein